MSLVFRWFFFCSDISKAIALLKEFQRQRLKAGDTSGDRSDQLNIEDILPFFPDFVKIADFKVLLFLVAGLFLLLLLYTQLQVLPRGVFFSSPLRVTVLHSTLFVFTFTSCLGAFNCACGQDEICDSLDQYHDHIAKLKEEMDEYTSSANLIRNDITQLRNRYGFVGQHPLFALFVTTD